MCVLTLSLYLYLGTGEFPCIYCSRYFISPEALATHGKTKVHRRAVKAQKDEPYSQAEAEAAAGLGSDYLRKKASAIAQKDHLDQELIMT